MASPAQIAASQQNAKKSTGRRTVEGKRRSSLNALTFGLFSNDIRQLFADEDRLRYDDFIKIHSDAFLPKGPKEEWLANKIAETMFLLDRAHDLNLHILCEPFNVEGAHRIGYASTEPLPNMALYKNRMRNDFERYSDRLEVMQAKRKELEEKEIIDAGVVAEACALTKTKFEPEKLGFDFSKKELVKRFLTSKVMMHAYSVLQPGIPDEDTKYAFGERMRMLIKMVDAA